MKGLPENFNWVNYLELNPDVKRVFKTELGAINHYLRYGKNENRKFEVDTPQVIELENKNVESNLLSSDEVEFITVFEVDDINDVKTLEVISKDEIGLVDEILNDDTKITKVKKSRKKK
jgi:hypothetical protein